MLRYRMLHSLPGVLIALGLAAAQASAASPTVEVETSASAPAAPQATSVCTLSAGNARATSFIWTPPEELTSMAWRIPVASCAACAPAPLLIKSLSFRLRWLFACTAQAQVLIVGAKPGTSCLEPDTTNVLCPAASYPIAGTGNASVGYTLAFIQPTCVSGDAFVLVRFTGLGRCALGGTSPGLAASTAACVPCDQFVTAANIFPNITEWCSIGASAETWFSIDADCCTFTPTRPRTWGSIKAHYR